ncbi:MAG: VOC family protein [Bacteroidota bacterium]
MDSKSSIAPWLSVNDGKRALEFYKNAFGATVVWQLDTPNQSVVAKLSVNGAEFWIGDGNDPQPLGGNSVRLILIVEDPDSMFARAINAGATEVYPVSEAHGWRIGRLIDPFGLHWEIGYQL